MEFSENHFGKYVLVSLLGRGGMGEVYKAWERPLARFVALKMLKDIDEDNLRRFEREAQLAAGLNHPNIAAIYELGQHDGRTYISMQYIEGKLLESYAGKLDTGLRAVRQAAGALAYAHGKGVIHRDINPRNIMVDVKGEAYVMDFGIARRKKAGGTVTETGVVVGTPGYMSPEQAQGLNLDERTDIYSLGATLYFICTHTAPFLGDEAINIVMRVVNEDPPPLRRLNPHIDRRLTTLVEKAMEKEPRRRYSTASQLEEDLRRYMADEPLVARRRPFLQRIFHRLRRNRTATAVVLIFFLISVASLTWLVTTRSWQRKEDRREMAFQLLPQLERIITEFELDPHWTEQEIITRCDRFDAKFKEVMEQQPDFSYAYVERAHLSWLLGDREGALLSLEKAISVEKDNAQAYLDLGRYRLKEYISSKIQQTARSLNNSLISPLSDPLSSKSDTPGMTSRLKSGLADIREFQRLARKQSGLPAAGEPELAFAQAVEAYVEGKRDEALVKLQRAQASSFVERDAKLFSAIVACESGHLSIIESFLADQGAPTRDYLEVRTYIAISLVFQLMKDSSPQSDQALVEDLARLMLVFTDPAALEGALQLPPAVQAQLQPYFVRARVRMQEIKAQ